ncbi:peptidoglycan recognition family protein [Sulfurimonas sp.]|uniref:peptidoglycan recognition protein family protein n=1 Tax=Sulfurimonas sp. TaxID=2022749 RepID=UPI0025EEDAFF|nr:peptidoglycan recognition family protein [Sulfurimonas sp.]MCK9474201.1 peptidoglycan recognition protein family protein [Sulfurimonas sp.]
MNETPLEILRENYEKMFLNINGKRRDKIPKEKQRADVIDYLVVHHSAGNEFINAAAIDIIDAFSRAGYTRGYAPIKREHSWHFHPLRDKETFAMAHFALHKYNKDDNIYRWRLVPLMADWDSCIAWHAGNWEINTRSIGIEICGDYSDIRVDGRALKLIADYFKPEYTKTRAAGKIYHVVPHRYVSLGYTVCPGKIIDQIDDLREMIFQGDKLKES